MLVKTKFVSAVTVFKVYVELYIYIYIYIYLYSEVMKTIQCAHPPHHHNGFMLCGDMPAMASSRIASVRTNRALNKH